MREREREGGGGGREELERHRDTNTHRQTEREGEREREREGERERDRGGRETLPVLGDAVQAEQVGAGGDAGQAGGGPAQLAGRPIAQGRLHVRQRVVLSHPGWSAT